MRMAALSTTFEPALLKRVKNFSLRAPSVAPREILLGRRYRRTGAPPLREEVVRPQRTTRGKENATPLHSQRIAHRGACGKTRFVPQNRRPRPEPAEMGVANARVVVDVRGAR
jgi:hypothetical protein